MFPNKCETYGICAWPAEYNLPEMVACALCHELVALDLATLGPTVSGQAFACRVHMINARRWAVGWIRYTAAQDTVSSEGAA